MNLAVCPGLRQPVLKVGVKQEPGPYGHCRRVRPQFPAPESMAMPVMKHTHWDVTLPLFSATTNPLVGALVRAEPGTTAASRAYAA